MAGELNSGTDRLLCVTNVGVTRDLDWCRMSYTPGVRVVQFQHPKCLGNLVVLACFHDVHTYHIIVTDPVRSLELHIGARSSKAAVLDSQNCTQDQGHFCGARLSD